MGSDQVYLRLGKVTFEKPLITVYSGLLQEKDICIL